MHISDDLRQYVADNPHIERVYFDRQGNHHFNVHQSGDKFYTRQRQVFEEAREDYEIIEILTREEILEQKTVYLGQLIDVDDLKKYVNDSIEALKKIEQLKCHKKVIQVSYVILNNQKYIPMGNQVLQLPQAGQPAVAYPVLDALVDAVSLKPIPGAVATLVSRTTDNSAVAVIDSNGNLLPVAAGTFNVVSTNSWNYTDEDTQQPVTGKQETSTTPYTVTSGPEQVVQTETLGAPVPAGTVPTAGATPAATPAAAKS